MWIAPSDTPGIARLLIAVLLKLFPHGWGGNTCGGGGGVQKLVRHYARRRGEWL